MYIFNYANTQYMCVYSQYVNTVLSLKYIVNRSLLQLAVPGAKNTRQFVSNKAKQQSTAPQYAVADDTRHPVPAPRSSVPHKTTVGGVPYALSSKARNQGSNNTTRDEIKLQKVCSY